METRGVAPRLRMDRVHELLDAVKQHGIAQGNLLGLLHVLIGRRITGAGGNPVSTGLTWRELARVLKRVRWDPESVVEIGLKPSDLPPRDRQRYWYTAIAQACVDSSEAIQAGNQFAEKLQGLGYAVGPGPKV